MYDCMGKVDCPDCIGTVEFSFTLALEGEYKMVSFGTCKDCYKRGDHRSVRATAEVAAQTWVKAVNHGLPVVGFGKRR